MANTHRRPRGSGSAAAPREISDFQRGLVAPSGATAHRAVLEDNLREIDGQIVKVARELADAIDTGTDWKGIDVTVGFLETLMRRRRVILGAYQQAGGRVKDLYTFGAHVERDGNGQET